jgi:tetratricopeptide (TPR) repeat protein
VQSALPAWMSTLWNRGWYKEAIDALELLTIRLSELSSTDPEVVLIYAQTKKFLGEFYYLIGDNQSGLREFQNGLQRINENDQSAEEKEEFEMFGLPGSYYNASGHNKDSKETYRLGLVLSEKVGDSSLVYKFINRLAMVSYLEADYQGGLPIAEHALELARQLEDKSKIVQSLNDLGNLYYAIKEYSRAKELLTEALAYLPEIKSQVMEFSTLNKLGKVLTANEEYLSASQTFSQGLNLIKDANADLWAVEMLVGVSELLNGMNEKSIAITLVNLLVDHPTASTDAKARAARLQKLLAVEKNQPENRNWSLGQMSRIVEDVKIILDQKNNLQ